MASMKPPRNNLYVALVFVGFLVVLAIMVGVYQLVS